MFDQDVRSFEEVLAEAKEQAFDRPEIGDIRYTADGLAYCPV